MTERTCIYCRYHTDSGCYRTDSSTCNNFDYWAPLPNLIIDFDECIGCKHLEHIPKSYSFCKLKHWCIKITTTMYEE